MKKIALTLVFCIFLSVFSVGSLIAPDRKFSENENRNLTTFPKPNLSSITSGEWQKKINSWYSDQLLLRDELISFKTGLQKLCGKKDIGGVYLCKKGFYIEKKLPDPEKTANFDKNLAVVSQFFENNQNTLGKENQSFMLVPSSADVLSKLLPEGALTPDYDYVYEKAFTLTTGKNVYVREKLGVNAECNFYKTDHHWTTDGAAIAYIAYCESRGLTPKPFERSELTVDFLGTAHSKVLDSAAKPDKIITYDLEDEPIYNVTADGKKLNFGLYDKSKLSTKDKYAYFFGGNYGKLTIENCGGKGHLLVIKDSFANCLLPFLLPHYEKVTVIDPRFYVGSVSEIITTEAVTEALLLYGVDTFMEEKTVSAILG